MADDLDQDEVFDEEDLAEGFDGDDAETDEFIDPDALDDDTTAVVDADDEGDDDVVADVVVEPAVVDDEDDLALDEDVELALDEVLAETMRLTTEVDDDEDAAPDTDDKGEPVESVLPKQDDEFRCKSCRLLKKVSQLADKDRTLCRDCV